MNARFCLFILTLTTMLSCNHGVIDLDIQGHRGCRGLMPENSIPGFIKAWDLGATTLEMDVVISRDSQVVVSHEPWFSGQICLDPGGQSIKKELAHNIFQMDYAEIAQWDCGSLGNSKFPDQKKQNVAKPLLRDVFKAVEALPSHGDYGLPKYNIEIKTEPNGVGVYHPGMDRFASLVLKEIREFELTGRSTLQSFNTEALMSVRRQDKEINLALLVDEGENHTSKIAELGFYPEVLSPYWKQVDAEMLGFAAEKHMKVIPWTVNEVEDMRLLIQLGVHGIITDYPDRLVNLLQEM
jgi:glycerophosphoryl diester phosphodiesterase